jgi:hypothetical protein
LFLVLVYSTPWIAGALLGREENAPERDILRPANILAGFGLLGTIYLFMLAADPSAIGPELRDTPWVRSIDNATVHYAAIMAAAFILTLAGIASPASGWLARRLPRLDSTHFTPRRCGAAIGAALAVGLAAYAYFLYAIGGLLNLWISLYNRTLITAGTGYIFYVYSLLLTSAALLLTYSLRFRRTPFRTGLVVAGLILVAGILGSAGARSGVIALFLLALMVWHYSVRRFRSALTPGTLVVGVFLLVVILVLPLFRYAGAYEKYTERPQLLVADAAATLGRVAPQFSMYDRGVIMLSYFDAGRFWWGASYRDLLYAPIPRSRFRNKPPVDDGVYFAEIISGREVRPSRPARELSVTSWPMGHFTAYMNFGWPGFIVVMLLIGIITGAAYEYMRMSGHSPFSIYVYQFVVMGGFTVSNYGLVNFSMTMAVVAGFFWVFFGRKDARVPRGSSVGVPTVGVRAHG